MLLMCMFSLLFASIDGQNGGYFKMFNGISKSVLTGCSSAQSHSKLGCVGLCLRNESCAGVFAELSVSEDNIWQCFLCPDPWLVDSLTPGMGHYAMAKVSPHTTQTPTTTTTTTTTTTPTTTTTTTAPTTTTVPTTTTTTTAPTTTTVPTSTTTTTATTIPTSTTTTTAPTTPTIPTIPSTVLENVQEENGRTVAVYRCTSNGRFFKLAYDDEHGEWPSLSPACQRSMCTIEGLLSMTVTIRLSAGVYIVEPYCKADERANGRLECSGGIWTEVGGLKTLCVSKSCQRTNSLSRAVYQGILDTTISNNNCQRWDKLTPHIHIYYLGSFFLEELGSVRDAENYCRDPSNNGYVWCYTTNIFKRWERCVVPECE